MNLRHDPRRMFLRPAAIIFDQAEVHCQLHNISDFGACLEVPDPHTIPDAFTLAIETPQQMLFCKVAWRSENRLGVTFSG